MGMSAPDWIRFVFFAIMLLIPLLAGWIWRSIRNRR